MALVPMKDILRDAQQRHYAAGFFNAISLEMVRAYIAAAEAEKSPIILGTAEVLLPNCPFEYVAPMLLNAAAAAKVPVAVHLDHGYDVEIIKKAMKMGFGSVMFDGSTLPYEENVKISCELSAIAHEKGIGLECELGHVGEGSDEQHAGDQSMYTDPDVAAEFLERTGADFLAVSIGTAHGVYKVTPKLDLNRLAQIHDKVSVPLVLHGGSGLSDSDFKNTVAGGISKINIFTDVILSGKRALCEASNMSYPDMLNMSIDAMRETTARKLRLFGSSQKA